MSPSGNPNDDPAGSPNRRMARFGPFEFDVDSGKLTRKGSDLGLQQQPSLLLNYLIQRASEIVTRDELRTAIWPSGTYVEFDLGLNTAISRLRRILGDSASDPRYIETVPKQGYRFVAPVELIAPETAPVPLPPPSIPPRRSQTLIIGGALALAAIALALYFVSSRSRKAVQPSSRMIRYTLSLPAVDEIQAIAISPTGDQIAYQSVKRGARMLYRRFLDEEESRPIAGSEGGEQPFFSPDGKQIGYYGPNSLKITGTGATRELAAVPVSFDFRKALWAPDGFIYFTNLAPDANQIAQISGIYRVSAQGGKPELIRKAILTDKGSTAFFGQDFRGNSHPALLFSTITGPLRRSIEWCDLEAGCNSTTRLVERGMGGQILPTGHLLYYWQGKLMAVRMNERSLVLQGSPVEVLSGIGVNGWRGGKVTVSQSGTLAYVKNVEPHRTLAWVARNGQETALPLPAANYEQAEVSPDGTRLAIARRDDISRWTLWIYDLRSRSWTRIAETQVPSPRALWSPDGKSLIASLVEGDRDFVNLYRINLASPATPERLTNSPDFGHFPLSWSGAANAVLFLEGVHPSTQSDIYALPLDGDRRPRPLVTSQAPDIGPAFSPDGRWFAYSTNPHAGSEVFIQPYDQSSPAHQVSQGGGSSPLWSADGKHLEFLGQHGSLMETAVDSTGHFDTPRQLLPAGFAHSVDWWTRPYSHAPDGRYLVLRDSSQSASAIPQIHVTVNWFQVLNRLAP